MHEAVRSCRHSHGAARCLVSRRRFTVHGHLNSDNIQDITGESFDYGAGLPRPSGTPNLPPLTSTITASMPLGSSRRRFPLGRRAATRAGCLSLVADAPALSDILASSSGRFRPGARPGRCSVASALIPARTTEDRGALRSALPLEATPSIASSSTGAAAHDAGSRACPACGFPAGSLGCSDSPSAPLASIWSDGRPCSMHIEEVEGVWTYHRRKRQELAAV